MQRFARELKGVAEASMDPISVRVFAAHPVARSQYQRVLAGESGIRCVEDAFDVGVFDAAAPPGPEGLFALARTKCPAMRGLLVSEAMGDDAYARWLLRGLWGVVACERYERELAQAVRHVAGGQLWFPPAIVARWMRHQLSVPVPLSPDGSGAGLTAREREVLELVQHRLANKEIGEVLRIGERTVKFHVSNILTKLGMRSRHDLVYTAAYRM